ncbi:hypothetical protein GCM10017786_14230 [Amycolatopsis deserti]|uniref:Peptidase M20 dimerisation domain-containing protein n=1 Tax=Amycolatopsis deserti TaxID=185696 RepID=A0ABQ3IL03_9PSEU|nr:amidohydrolase [Amycolatopsis deserti]GHE84047.1 hypothetical protein GCM10017786_14230 [Amycolatopsis deserti]
MDDEQLTALRRELHRHPEPAFAEVATAARIERALAGLPLRLRTGADAHDLSGVVAYPAPEVLDEWERRAVESGVDPARAKFFRTNGTALVADLDGNAPGPRWGLRVDIDALPMRESSDPDHVPVARGFVSRTGAMHACGHDAHATIGVGLLHRLSGANFPGSLRVLFQPAEEGVRGAQTMIDAGVADDIDRMLAVHVAGDKPAGAVVGSFTGGLATRKLEVRFTGTASHAAGAPEEGRNALLAAAVTALGVMALPRFSSADTRLNVGTLVAGDGVNIVPSWAVLTCEARATDDDVVEDLVARIRAVADGAALTQGVDASVAVTGQSATLAPDEEVVDLVVAAAGATPGVTEIVRTETLAGSDDANLLIRHVQRRGGQGAYLMVGASSPAPHHSARFDIDEQAIPLGIAVLENLIRGGHA